MADLNFKTTASVKIPEKLVDQVIGQKNAVDIIKKAAKQRRNVLLIGEPGTGKTMLAQAMAELLPAADLEDVLAYKNPNDENVPLIKSVRTYPDEESRKKLGNGQGRLILQKERAESRLALGRSNSIVAPIVIVLVMVLFGLSLSGFITGNELIVLGALMLGIMIFGSMLLFMGGLSRRVGLPGLLESSIEPKLIVDNTGKGSAPFIDATGSKAGALFGDVRHDPLQTGGLGTPAHLRVEGGAIHKANKGVLFIDEISALDPKSQQDLLTALQEKKYPITGQSEMSSGALVKSEPAPCDFILVAAGNLQDLRKMHPALRSRIRGYGYEVYMESTMPDNAKDREALAQFIAQEIRKDGKIPSFDESAVKEIMEEARRRAGRKSSLTLILRDLGGLIRAAGDIAIENGKRVVTKGEVIAARKLASPIEAQVVDQIIAQRKGYEVFEPHGYRVGKVNGLAVVMLTGNAANSAGIVVPIVAEVTPASSRITGRFIPTGRLGRTASEAVKNVSAIIKKHMGRDVASYDIHVQFLQTEGVEGDSASISVAVSIISAMENLAVDQSIAMTGSLSVRGAVLPVGGITSKVEAAINAGLKKVIMPASNVNDVYISKEMLKKIQIVQVRSFADVIRQSIKKSKRRDEIIRELSKHEAA